MHLYLLIIDPRARKTHLLYYGISITSRYRDLTLTCYTFTLELKASPSVPSSAYSISAPTGSPFPSLETSTFGNLALISLEINIDVVSPSKEVPVANITSLMALFLCNLANN